MKTLLAYLLVVTVAGGFGSGTACYIAGRILLPELHLPVPAYGAFFWACFWVVLFGSAIHFLISLLED